MTIMTAELRSCKRKLQLDRPADVHEIKATEFELNIAIKVREIHDEIDAAEVHGEIEATESRDEIEAVEF